jgi:membrane protein YqaA with SNARE-associated domain
MEIDKRLEGALYIISAIAVVAIALYFSAHAASLGGYGYLGAFLISALCSATILFPAPGWAVIAAMGAYMNPYLLGLAAGAGSALGELTGYAAGEGTRDILNSNIKESERIHAFVGKYGLFAIFSLAFIPNPLFDVAGLVSGALRIPWWRFLIACAAGRVLRYILLAMLGSFTLGLIS